jgi:hypothetical protein
MMNSRELVSFLTGDLTGELCICVFLRERLNQKFYVKQAISCTYAHTETCLSGFNTRRPPHPTPLYKAYFSAYISALSIQTALSGQPSGQPPSKNTVCTFRSPAVAMAKTTWPWPLFQALAAAIGAAITIAIRVNSNFGDVYEIVFALTQKAPVDE